MKKRRQKQVQALDLMRIRVEQLETVRVTFGYLDVVEIRTDLDRRWVSGDR